MTILYAKAGESVRIRWAYDQPANVAEVAAACELNEGHWYCETHGEGFPHNFASTSHVEQNEGCRFVWICHHHGPEQGGTE